MSRVSLEGVGRALIATLAIDLAKQLWRTVRAQARPTSGGTMDAMHGVFALPVNFPQQPPPVKARMLAADRLWRQAVLAAS